MYDIKGIIAVIGIIGLEAYALYLGFNGAMLTMVLAMLGVYAGSKITDEQKKKLHLMK